jgi:hypothetical protein
MTCEIIECEQNSPEWLRARMGIPTASAFSDVLAKGEGKTRRTYMLKLAGELITGEPMESFSNAHTERGHLLEEEARDLYTLQTGADIARVGFIRNGRAGCSPDSLIGEEGGLEIKTKLPHLLIETIWPTSFRLNTRPRFKERCGSLVGNGGIWRSTGPASRCSSRGLSETTAISPILLAR